MSSDRFTIRARRGSAEPLGVTLDDGGVNVAVFAAGAASVYFCFLDTEGREHRVELVDRDDDVFHGFVPDVAARTRYGFRADGPWDPAHGSRFNVNKFLIDPYARAVSGELTLDSAIYGHVGDDDLIRNDIDSMHYVPHGIVVETEPFDWGDDTAPRTPLERSVIYELHVKGFTQSHPGIPPELRGTFAGLAHPTAIAHLHTLGVSAVELLPVHQFASETALVSRGVSNYWGYNSIAFLAPHNQYCASGDLGQQIPEFKSMVKELHAAGIEVILDVVYNHTAEYNEFGPTLSFRGLANQAYYHLDETGRSYRDYTGCKNSVDTTAPMPLRLIIDSLRYWVEEMHVDGFRFDLAPELARAADGEVDMRGPFMTAIHADPVLQGVKLIAEPWDVSAGGYQLGNFGILWSEWNGKYRDVMRDVWRSRGGMSEVGTRLAGSEDLFAHNGRTPASSINFITAHDGFTLRDLVSYNLKHNVANGEGNQDGSSDNLSWNSGVEGEAADPGINALRGRRMRSMLTTLILAAGTPMLVAGDEFGRTQRGNNNAYCQDDEISWLNWDLQAWQESLLRFTRALIDLKRSHPVFGPRAFFTGEPIGDTGVGDLEWFDADGARFSPTSWDAGIVAPLAMFLNGAAAAQGSTGEATADDSFLLLLNPTEAPVTFRLPSERYAGAYAVTLDSALESQPSDPASVAAGESVTVADYSTVVLRSNRSVRARALEDRTSSVGDDLGVERQ